MGRVGEERGGEVVGVSSLVAALGIFVVLGCAVVPSRGVVGQWAVSETCYGTGNCSLHVLQCEAGHRLAVMEASYGFKLKDLAVLCESAVTGDICPDHCCSYNASSDCRQTFTADNLERVQSECSHSATCHIRAQRGDNTVCSTQQRGITSTLSVLRALCVPDASSTTPCSNSTVSGDVVSLHLSHPPPSSPCHCSLHPTTPPTSTTDANSSQVLSYVFEVNSTSSGWGARVEDREGRGVMEVGGAGSTFPADTSPSPRPLSSLPFSLTFTFDDPAHSPQRLWLGFRGQDVSLTLRCGQDAVDYAESLITTTPPPPSTTTSVSTAPQTTPVNTTHSTTGREQTTSSREESSGPLTSDTTPKDTTDIIVYTMVGVAVLVVCAFVYVFGRQLRKKGCPDCCPQLCQQLHCGKGRPQDPDRRQPSHAHPASGESAERGASGDVCSNGVHGHGQFVQLTGEGGAEGSGGVVPSAFTQRRCSFEHLKRHRGSVQSLRRASFSSLEDIKETEEDEVEEEEESSTLPDTHPDHPPAPPHNLSSLPDTHPDHPPAPTHNLSSLPDTHPDHPPAPTHNQQDIVNKTVDKHVTVIKVDTTKEDKQSEDNSRLFPTASRSGSRKASDPPTTESQHCLAEQEAGKDNRSEDRGGRPGGASVVFHVGDSSPASDSSVEQYFTKL